MFVQKCICNYVYTYIHIVHIICIVDTFDETTSLLQSKHIRPPAMNVFTYVYMYMIKYLYTCIYIIHITYTLDETTSLLQCQRMRPTTGIHICIYVYMYICTYSNIFLHKFVLHMRIYVSKYICIYSNMYIHSYILYMLYYICYIYLRPNDILAARPSIAAYSNL